MNTKGNKIIFIYGISIAVAILNIFFAFCLNLDGERHIYSVSDSILLSTAIVLGIYTFETYKLREIQGKQIKLNITPILNLTVIEDNLYIENVSNNFAKNIQITSLKTENNEYFFNIDQNYLSEKSNGQNITITYKSAHNNEDKFRNFIFFLIQIGMETQKNEIYIPVQYEDINNEKHFLKLHIWNFEEDPSHFRTNIIY